VARRALIPELRIPGPFERRRRRVRTARAVGVVFAGLLLAAGLSPPPAAGGSSLRLPGSELGAIEATTFDEQGRRVGRSSFALTSNGSGRITMTIEISVAGGGVNRSEAVLDEAPSPRPDSAPESAPESAPVGAPVPAPDTATPTTRELRLVEQRSRATRADGQALDLLVIDHERGRASCYADGDGPLRDGRHLELPEDERVVNVPLQLLFRPLVEREVDAIRFQIALCRGEPVLHDMIAVRGPVAQQEGRRIVEVRYGPDLGRAFSWLASRLLPRLSFWLDEETGTYLAHRMPLHTGGPEVLLVRSGLEPADLRIR